VSFENTPDEGLITFYESIRQQVELDRPHKRKFMGPSVREYADRLRHEMVKRRLQHSPIAPALPDCNRSPPRSTCP
jgi:hypothetical protein